MKEIKAPDNIDQYLFYPKIFLAGSIEMGSARDWQQEVVEACKDLDVVLLNPRRDDFDPTAGQTIENDYFREQVEWELEALEEASLILLYFDPNTKAPISLLELGLFADSGKLIVCCPKGFWRKGNVDIVCKFHLIYLTEDLDDAIDELSRRLRKIT